MTFKIEKNIPYRKFYSPFCEVLDRLEVGDSIPGFTKKEAYKYRVNFYTKTFSDRKFSLGKDMNDMCSYRIWRIA
jgi:hypothetical protein